MVPRKERKPDMAFPAVTSASLQHEQQEMKAMGHAAPPGPLKGKARYPVASFLIQERPLS